MTSRIEAPKSSEENKALIRRYYLELWNAWSFSLAEELVSPDIDFRGSLGIAVRGLEGFKGYMNRVRSAFPDFHNTIEDLIAEGNTVVARLTYTATHRGELFGIEPTGRRVAYPGVAVFTISEGKIRAGWALGDTDSLRAQLAAD